MDHLESKIDYFFKNKDLLKQALTHPSFKHDHTNYERLEFLGDSVLNLVISEYLMSANKDSKEGDLAARRAYLISGNIICAIAKNINLGNYLLLARSEINSGGVSNPNNLENALEAIIGAIFIDSDYQEAKKIVLYLWSDYLDLEVDKHDLNPKSFLQEWSSQHYHNLPKYTVIEQSGPDHSRLFVVQVEVEGFDLAHGKGASLKKAEIDAAKMLIKKINKDKEQTK